MRVFDEEAKRICQLQVLDRTAVDFEEPRRADDVRNALRPGNRDVKTIPRHQEVESARDVFSARRDHRVKDGNRLATLELVDSADLDRSWKSLAQQPHLRV